METLAVLEFLGRRGEVIRTELVRQFPISLGRAVDNDVIVSDPCLAPHHICIEKDDRGFIAIDLNSRNGMSTTRNPAKSAEIRLDGDTIVRLGHTQIRLRGRDEAMLPEQDLPQGKALRQPLLFTLSLVVVTSLFWLESYFTSPSGIDLEKSGAAYVMIMVKLLAWIAIWSSASKFFSGKGLFVRHGALAGLGLLAWTVLENVLSMAAFSFSWGGLQKYAFLLLALVLWFVVYRHVSLISRIPRLLRSGGALLLMLALQLGYWAYYHSTEKEDWGATTQYIELWPSTLLAVPGEPIEVFFAQADELRRDAEAKRDDTQ